MRANNGWLQYRASDQRCDSHTVNVLDVASKPVLILSDSVPPPRLTWVLSLLAGGVIRRPGSTRPRVTRF